MERNGNFGKSFPNIVALPRFNHLTERHLWEFPGRKFRKVRYPSRGRPLLISGKTENFCSTFRQTKVIENLNRNFVSNGKHRSFTFSLFPRSFVEIVVCIRAWE